MQTDLIEMSRTRKAAGIAKAEQRKLDEIARADAEIRRDERKKELESLLGSLAERFLKSERKNDTFRWKIGWALAENRTEEDSDSLLGDVAKDLGFYQPSTLRIWRRTGERFPRSDSPYEGNFELYNKAASKAERLDDTRTLNRLLKKAVENDWSVRQLEAEYDARIEPRTPLPPKGHPLRHYRWQDVVDAPDGPLDLTVWPDGTYRIIAEDGRTRSGELTRRTD
jgi:hypothetical protein